MIILPVEKRIDWSNPPIVLAFLIILNSFIYFFYQLDDQKNLDNAIQSYTESGLLNIEYKLYIDYLKESDQLNKAHDFEDAYANEEHDYLIINLLHDLEFRHYLDEEVTNLIFVEQYGDWLSARKTVNDMVDDLSYFRFGLIPARCHIFNLVSHQFMHGNFMHLLGNMIFLVMCGFVVEAAIGHLRFIIFYLLSGVAGGLLHSAADFTSYMPLVGASGAISGVMAMYLAVFKLKKIEFFYWFFAFVGYFRAPALILLPIYIAMELVQLFSAGESNVAFLAHVGGFIAGSVLIGLFLLFGTDLIDEEYIEEDQSIDSDQEKLNEIYKPLERYNINRTLENLEQQLTHKDDLNLRILQIKLLSSLQQDPANASKVDHLVLEFLSDSDATKLYLDDKANLFTQYRALVESSYSSVQLSKLGISFCRLDDIRLAESIFEKLYEAESENTGLFNNLGIFARRLSHCFEKNNNIIKKNQYNELADKWLDTGSIGFSDGRV